MEEKEKGRMEEKEKGRMEQRSAAATIAGIFTVKWLVQTLAAWAVTLGLTKLWNKLRKRNGNSKKI